MESFAYNFTQRLKKERLEIYVCTQITCSKFELLLKSTRPFIFIFSQLDLLYLE